MLAAAIGAGAGCGDDEGGKSAEAAKADTDTLTFPEGLENPPMHARVEMTKDGYKPKHTKILVGGTVTFVNMETTGSYTAETGDLPDGLSDNNEFDTHTLTWEEPYKVYFHKPEKVTYYNSFDSTMRGTVTAVPKILPIPPSERPDSAG